MPILVSAVRRIFRLPESAARWMWIELGCARFREMPRIRAALFMIRGHPFASDAALAFVLAALVLSEVFTSKGYLTGSNWVYVPVAVLMTVPLALRRLASGRRRPGSRARRL